MQRSSSVANRMLMQALGQIVRDDNAAENTKTKAKPRVIPPSVAAAAPRLISPRSNLKKLRSSLSGGTCACQVIVVKLKKRIDRLEAHNAELSKQIKKLTKHVFGDAEAEDRWWILDGKMNSRSEFDDCDENDESQQEATPGAASDAHAHLPITRAVNPAPVKKTVTKPRVRRIRRPVLRDPSNANALVDATQDGVPACNGTDLVRADSTPCNTQLEDIVRVGSDEGLIQVPDETAEDSSKDCDAVASNGCVGTGAVDANESDTTGIALDEAPAEGGE
eukprot:Rmarinus@m.2493